jgi:hypothetical protein
MMKTRIATAVAVLAAAACSTHGATPAPSTATSAPPPTVELQPGPHSAIAVVDLPEGTVQCTTIACFSGLPIKDPHEEYWRYSAPYDDTVAFLQKRFATGRRYDTHGATWWKGLPPCYDKGHQSPPWGHTLDGGTEWVWSDGAVMLAVTVMKPGLKTTGGDIVPFGTITVDSWIVEPEVGTTCYRA